MQAIITAIILFCALCYTLWRIYKAFKRDEDPCCCCEQKKNCKKFGSVREK